MKWIMMRLIEWIILKCSLFGYFCSRLVQSDRRLDLHLNGTSWWLSSVVLCDACSDFISSKFECKKRLYAKCISYQLMSETIDTGLWIYKYAFVNLKCRIIDRISLYAYWVCAIKFLFSFNSSLLYSNLLIGNPFIHISTKHKLL